MYDSLCLYTTECTACRRFTYKLVASAEKMSVGMMLSCDPMSVINQAVEICFT